MYPTNEKVLYDKKLKSKEMDTNYQKIVWNH